MLGTPPKLIELNKSTKKMTDDEFKRHLYRQLELDQKNHGQMTNRIFANPKNRPAQPSKQHRNKPKK